MAIMLKKKNETVSLSNTDEAFVGTPLANEPFVIEITKIKKAESINMLSASANEDGTIKQGDYSRDLFISSISNVDGFVDENQEHLGIDEGFREIVWEYGSDILVEAIKDKIKSLSDSGEKKSEIQENDSVTIPAGQ